ncbi:MAG: hypothetical protein GY795_07045 [Desulfobacterales bacterium]|nr:hypothetical protein [Desulfobacterales bacterium]
MIRINLLPYRAEKQKETARNQVIIYIVGLALLIGILFWINSYMAGIIEGLNTKIAFTNKEIAKYQAIVKQVEEIERQLAILKKKLKAIYDLNKRRKEALKVFDTLTGMVVENRMWIISLDAKEKIKKIRQGTGKQAIVITIVNIDFRISGIALDNKTVADFMTNLQNKMDPDQPFIITDQSLIKIKEEGVPEDVLAKLESLKDKEHETEYDFTEALNTAIGEALVVKHKTHILKYTGKDFYIGTKLLYSRERVFPGNVKLKDFQISCSHQPLEKRNK